ncbi:cell division cycle protein [Mariannaea sp. PMI_226]|nr:cell division cycle protein [Mariannaea sp. PMI_226]
MAPAPPPPEPQWPPRSPHEALCSTPKGRERYRRMLDQTSPSPSPSGRARNLPAVNLLQAMDQDEDEDEDEETLQLKLQEIQARLKLKKLQNAKSQKVLEDGVDSLGTTTSELAISTGGRGRLTQPTSPTESSRQKTSASQYRVEVPASPVRKLQLEQTQASPERVLLGIDKGLTSKDVSLKRAPSYRNSQISSDSSSTGGYLRRSRTTSNVTSSFENSRPLSFNERLASARNEETTRKERQEKIQKMRSTAFGIDQQKMDQFKKTAIDIPDELLQPPVFSRDQVMSNSHSATGGFTRSNTAPSFRAGPNSDSATTSTRSASGKPAPGDVPEEQASAFEPYSSFHLSKRIIPHTVLTRQISGKKVYTLKNLLKEVKSPYYSLPDIEQDIVIFAILAKKSDPRSHKPVKNGGEDRGKYMVLNLVDLEYELDLFLFNSGFNRFWKLTEGTVLAILNPSIMPPPPGRQDTGKFSLVINSDADTIMEIGKARDLGYCESMKKDGQRCGAWVNWKRTHFCEHHSNQAINKKKAGRVEMNGSSFGARKNNSYELNNWEQKEDDERDKEKRGNYDWETKTRWFASRTMSAADLIDGKDRTPADRKDRAEFMKRDLEAKEREREMMRKLGEVGNAAGREYMRRSGSLVNGRSNSVMAYTQESNSQISTEEPARLDAKSLGLLTKRSDIHLSPIKRKRPDSSQAGSLASSRTSTLGWGSNLKDKLSKMKEGEKLRKEDVPPVRKKTRFVTEKGIREAGRESLGNDLMERQVTLEDDDDELVIV